MAKVLILFLAVLLANPQVIVGTVASIANINLQATSSLAAPSQGAINVPSKIHAEDVLSLVLNVLFRILFVFTDLLVTVLKTTLLKTLSP